MNRRYSIIFFFAFTSLALFVYALTPTASSTLVYLISFFVISAAIFLIFYQNKTYQRRNGNYNKVAAKRQVGLLDLLVKEQRNSTKFNFDTFECLLEKTDHSAEKLSLLVKSNEELSNNQTRLIASHIDLVQNQKLPMKEYERLAIEFSEVQRELAATKKQLNEESVVADNKILAAQKEFFNQREEYQLKISENFRSLVLADPNAVIKEYFPSNYFTNFGVGSAGLETIGDTYSYYGKSFHKDVSFMEKFVLRSNSKLGREIIARSVSNLEFTYSELLRIVRLDNAQLSGSRIQDRIKSWNKKSLLSLGRVLASQNFDNTDLTDARSIFTKYIDLYGFESLPRADKFVYLEVLNDLNKFDDLISTLPLLDQPEDSVQKSLLESNLLHEQDTVVENLEDKWIGNINEMYSLAGLSKIFLEPGKGLKIDRLRPVPDLNTISGPLVTVIMPTYNGSDFILTSVNSVLNQSWSNLELIIVDDGSEKAHWEKLNNILPADTRIKLLRLHVNSGAYVARNLALESATGEFITVHDDDDWSHPQKIEIQMADILADSSRIANMSYMTRIDENDRFLRINDNPEFSQRNYSSLLISRKHIDEYGRWDMVTRGGDAEFHERITALTGKRIIGVQTPPMSFARARSGSLTHGEINKGFIDPLRTTYGLSFMAWHKELKENPRLLKERPISSRPFRAPWRIMASNKGIEPRDYDVIYATDFRFPGGNSTLVAAEIEASLGMGLKVGICQIDSPSLRAVRPVNSKITDLLLSEDIDFLTLADEVRCSLLVLRHPTIMQFADNRTSRISPDMLALIVNNPPVGLDGKESVFDLDTCARNAQQLFGLECIVYPESWQIRGICEAIWPSLNYASDNWPGFLNLDQFQYRVPRVHEPSALPMVGRHSRDHRLKWPDTEEEILEAYLQPGVFQTSILGGVASIRDLLTAKQLEDLHVIEFGAIDPASYLTTLDFWVYFHSENLTESFGMSIIEAMSSGIVTILPQYMEPMFGDGAIYGSAQDVRFLVKEYWDDKELYRIQSERGRAQAQKLYSVGSYQKRITSILDSLSVAAQNEE